MSLVLDALPVVKEPPTLVFSLALMLPLLEVLLELLTTLALSLLLTVKVFLVV